jgi:hypothetical protein
MSITKRAVAVMASAVLLWGGSLASAGTINAKFTGANPAAGGFKVVTGNGTYNNVTAGRMNWKQNSFTTDVNGSGNLVGNGGTFVTYCIDLAQHVANNTNYSFTVTTTTSAVPNPSATTGTLATPWAGDVSKSRAAALLRLFSKHYGEGFTDNVKQAAFQLAVWEITFETAAGNKTLGGGTTVISNGNASARSQADIWLSGLFSVTDDGDIGSLRFLSSGSSQDQIHYNPLSPGPTPIPVPLASVGGIALIGMLAAKRSLR